MTAGGGAADVTGEPLLTDAELEALSLSGSLANACRKIIGDGPSAAHDWAEMAHRIHDIQHAILAQAAARAYPNQFRLLGGSVMASSVWGPHLLVAPGGGPGAVIDG